MFRNIRGFVAIGAVSQIVGLGTAPAAPGAIGAWFGLSRTRRGADTRGDHACGGMVLHRLLLIPLGTLAGLFVVTPVLSALFREVVADLRAPSRGLTIDVDTDSGAGRS